MKLPTFTIDRLYHIGALDSRKKSDLSYEGHCLSASLCPNAWQSIAKIGGDCHQLHKPGAIFLNVTSLLNNSALEKRLLKFGKDHGYIELAEVYELSWYDDEFEETMSFRVRTMDEAFYESEDREDMNIKPMKDWVETQGLLDKTLQKRSLDSSDPRSLLAVAYAEHLAEQGHPIDGVFMDHLYEPHNLSAPAFGILPSKLTDYSVSIVPTPDEIVDARLKGKDQFLDLSKPAIETNQRRHSESFSMR